MGCDATATETGSHKSYCRERRLTIVAAMSVQPLQAATSSSTPQFGAFTPARWTRCGMGIAHDSQPAGRTFLNSALSRA